MAYLYVAGCLFSSSHCLSFYALCVRQCMKDEEEEEEDQGREWNEDSSW
jgi:hypothetical protein